MNAVFPRLHLTINGDAHTLIADPLRRLSDVLRSDLRLQGTKVGCDAGDCGACTVLIDGRRLRLFDASGPSGRSRGNDCRRHRA